MLIENAFGKRERLYLIGAGHTDGGGIFQRRFLAWDHETSLALSSAFQKEIYIMELII